MTSISIVSHLCDVSKQKDVTLKKVNENGFLIDSCFDVHNLPGELWTFCAYVLKYFVETVTTLVKIMMESIYVA